LFLLLLLGWPKGAAPAMLQLSLLMLVTSLGQQPHPAEPPLRLSLLRSCTQPWHRPRQSSQIDHPPNGVPSPQAAAPLQRELSEGSGREPDQISGADVIPRRHGAGRRQRPL